MKNALQLSAFLLLILTACAASRPKEPWIIQVRTAGGLTGRGMGSYSIDSDGKVRIVRANGSTCEYDATKDELRRITELLGAAHAREWKPAYVPENSCCDRFEYLMIIDEASVVTQTRWIDDPLPMPSDLQALTDAIVGGEKSIRVTSSERCK